MQFAPLDGEPETYCPVEILQARWKAHAGLDYLASVVRRGGADLAFNSACFGQCLKLAVFELRHRLVQSWAGFALLFFKVFGDCIRPWLASLFLAALAQRGVPRPDFDLDEVLAFATAFPLPPATLHSPHAASIL